MLFFFISPFPSIPRLPKLVHELGLLSFLLLRELLLSLWVCLKMPEKPRPPPKTEDLVGMTAGPSILDLPELALECILEKLSPAALASMACACSSLRERCTGDHLWERHMREKWSRVLGWAARCEWDCYVACRKDSWPSAGAAGSLKPHSWTETLSCFWPLSWFMSKLSDDDSGSRPARSPSMESIMSWYLALESGKFRFPAQVYNREVGHTGFILSCYDAQISYDRRTDTFCARYQHHGQKRPAKLEDGIQWSRLRAPPADTGAHDLHVSDCLGGLCPGDHFEIQWRKSKEFPHGWWYGVVGHLESCNQSQSHCFCREDDTIILEFRQYAPGSRWRRAAISRKNQGERGDEADGFYGGIRKLESKDEISTWRRFWPAEILD